MSVISNKVYDTLKELFPLNIIIKEHYVKYKGSKLFFDFYIKDLNVLIEVQGRQHTRFVKHFHEERGKFVAQKNRDNLKIEYAQKNNIALTRFGFDEKITKNLVMRKIYNAIERGFYE